MEETKREKEKIKAESEERRKEGQGDEERRGGTLERLPKSTEADNSYPIPCIWIRNPGLCDSLELAKSLSRAKANKSVRRIRFLFPQQKEN